MKNRTRRILIASSLSALALLTCAISLLFADIIRVRGKVTILLELENATKGEVSFGPMAEIVFVADVGKYRLARVANRYPFEVVLDTTTLADGDYFVTVTRSGEKYPVQERKWWLRVMNEVRPELVTGLVKDLKLTLKLKGKPAPAAKVAETPQPSAKTDEKPRSRQEPPGDARAEPNRDRERAAAAFASGHGKNPLDTYRASPQGPIVLDIKPSNANSAGVISPVELPASASSRGPALVQPITLPSLEDKAMKSPAIAPVELGKVSEASAVAAVDPSSFILHPSSLILRLFVPFPHRPCAISLCSSRSLDWANPQWVCTSPVASAVRRRAG